MENKKLSTYLNDIGGQELLSDEQEQALAERIGKGDAEAVNQLVSANLRYVVKVAQGYSGQGLALDDLVSEGNIGMMRAAKKFTGSRKKRFVVFAAPYVRESIEHAINEQAGTLPNVPKGEGLTRSVDEPIPIGSKNSYSLLHVLEDKDSPRADLQVDSATLSDEMAAAMDALNERERQVVSSYFGIGCEPVTMAEIGMQMGLKRERVRQIRDKAVRKMKKYRQ
ncbi:MAG: sigma-70 family RNA polymerase sigma factor [Prevotella sp.]|nr:sigma-70 family RNA polymerase sigma factor [Prevotella sp.]